jgi:hypothetical protein
MVPADPGSCSVVAPVQSRYLAPCPETSVRDILADPSCSLYWKGIPTGEMSPDFNDKPDEKAPSRASIQGF